MARRAPGDLLPTIAEVTERFDVGGVQTVRNGYQPLIDEGLVVRLDSPRRWAVVDHGQEPVPGPDVAARLDELESVLLGAVELVRDLRKAA
ncbi:hypothetical protein A8M60_11905 [Nocardia farcinica]|nr:hypothetical protein A8M60_11905 [Nocardia farcinica]